VSLPSTTNLSDLAAIHAPIQERFPRREEKIESKLKVELPALLSKSPTFATSSIGYLFRSPTGGKVVQSRFNGFTFNKLKPYESWQAFKCEAQELWEMYRDIVRPTKIRRFSLRYINRIVIPFGVDTKEYFLTGPEISPELPQIFRSFFLRVEIVNEEIPALGMINQAAQPADETGLPIIFDIDVVKTIELSPNTKDLWYSFEKLRDFKNDIFFKSLTEKTKEMFK